MKRLGLIQKILTLPWAMLVVSCASELTFDQYLPTTDPKLNALDLTQVELNVTPNEDLVYYSLQRTTPTLVSPVLTFEEGIVTYLGDLGYSDVSSSALPVTLGSIVTPTPGDLVLDPDGDGETGQVLRFTHDANSTIDVLVTANESLIQGESCSFLDVFQAFSSLCEIGQSFQLPRGTLADGIPITAVWRKPNESESISGSSASGVVRKVRRVFESGGSESLFIAGRIDNKIYFVADTDPLMTTAGLDLFRYDEVDQTVESLGGVLQSGGENTLNLFADGRAAVKSGNFIYFQCIVGLSRLNKLCAYDLTTQAIVQRSDLFSGNHDNPAWFTPVSADVHFLTFSSGQIYQMNLDSMELKRISPGTYSDHTNLTYFEGGGSSDALFFVQGTDNLIGYVRSNIYTRLVLFMPQIDTTDSRRWIYQLGDYYFFRASPHSTTSDQIYIYRVKLGGGVTIDRAATTNPGGVGEPQIENLQKVTDALIYSARNDSGERKLWMLDPVSLVSTQLGAFSKPSRFVEKSGWIYLAADVPSGQRKLIRYNLTTRVTEQISNFRPGASDSVENISVSGERIFFSALDENDFTRLYVYEVGSQALHQVAKINEGNNDTPSDLMPLEGGGLFLRLKEEGDKLKVTHVE